jgi:hypothetical protein
MELVLQDKQRDESGPETAPALRAYLHYRAMGIKRSLRKLHALYSDEKQFSDWARKEGFSGADSEIPTRRLSTIEEWSSRWKWQERIEEWENGLEAERAAEAQEMRLAARAIRRKILDRMYTKLVKQGMYVDLKEDPYAFSAYMGALKTFLEQSRKEHNDLPTTKTDVSTKGKALQVVFNIAKPEGVPAEEDLEEEDGEDDGEDTE